MAGGTGGQRNIKLSLMNKHPFCYWCGIKVKDSNIQQFKGKADEDEATIDHMESRYFRKKGDITRKVLSCYKCNFGRSIKESRKMVLISKLFRKPFHLLINKKKCLK